MAGKRAAQAAPEPEAAPGPAYYVATRALHVGGGDALPVLAYPAGSHVLPDVAEANPDWQAFLASPDDDAAASAAVTDEPPAAPEPEGAAPSAGSGQGEEQ